MTSEELFRGCCANEEEAWTYAYNYAIQFLQKKLGKNQDIKDAAQNAMLYFINNGLSIITFPRAYKSWLKKKAWACYIDIYRSQRIRQHNPLEITDENGKIVGEEQGLEPSPPDAEEMLFYQKARVVFDSVLKDLGEKCEKLLKGYYRMKIEGGNQTELAEEVNLPYKNIRVEIWRCKQKLFDHSAYIKLLSDFKQH